MGTLAHRHRLRRSRLSWHRTPISPVNRSLPQPVLPSSRSRPAAAAPVREWPGRETRDQAERWNDDRLEALLPRLPNVARRSSSVTARTIAARCRSVPFARATIGRARLRNSMPWPKQPTPGPVEVATIYLDLFPPGSLADADFRAPVKCSANVWTARASRARLWREGLRWLGRRTGSAGSCMPKCSPSASTRTPGSSSKPPWKTAAPRIPSRSSRCATPTSSSPTASSS